MICTLKLFFEFSFYKVGSRLDRQYPSVLKRLYKVGLTARVESFDNKESLRKDASKQERIDAINPDEEITLVSVENVDEEMFDVNVLDVEVINTAKLITDAAQVSVAGNVVSTAGDATTVSAATTNTATITIVDDITLAQALMEIKSTNQIRKGLLYKSWVNLQQHYLHNNHKTKENIDVDHQLDERLQAEEQEELAFKRVNTFEDFRTELVEGKEKRAGTELIQENAKKHKVEDDKETAELKYIVGWKIYKEGRKSYYQIMRANGKSQTYMIFSPMLKSFDMYDLEDLYKLVKAKYESTRPVEDLDLLLWGDLKIMFEPHVEDNVWRNQQEYKVLDWKLYDSRRVHSLRMQHMQIYMLVEKKYPLAPLTISMMLQKKLIIDYESEMAYQLLKFIIK
ncbi:hypothetical protein Tco_0758184 [Tanacetum coccineum]